MPLALAARITVDEYTTRAAAETDDDILSREELIDGEIVPMPIPFKIHDLIKNRIMRHLGRYLDERDLGLCLVETGFQIDSFNCLVPDVAFLAHARADDSSAYFQGAPDIVFEVISTERLSHFDAKLAAYFRGGASYVCSVHIDTRNVTVHSRRGVTQRNAGEILDFPDVLPDFSLPVDSLFE